LNETVARNPVQLMGEAIMKKSVQTIVAASIFTLGFFAAAHGAVGAPPESETARAIYKSAAQGDPDAQTRLGELYAKGIEVEQSDATAFQWFMRAAAQGHTRAQLTLAEIWTNGRAVPRSDSLAYRWALIARTNSVDPDIRDAADRLLANSAKNLYADQIAAARQRAAEWKADVETSQTVASEPAAVSAARTQAKPAARKGGAARVGAAKASAARVAATKPTYQLASGGKARAALSGSSEKRNLHARLERLARRLGL
jgi:TPR repeat protein